MVCISSGLVQFSFCFSVFLFMLTTLLILLAIESIASLYSLISSAYFSASRVFNITTTHANFNLMLFNFSYLPSNVLITFLVSNKKSISLLSLSNNFFKLLQQDK